MINVDPRALQNRGETITLLDGRTATLSFDLEALAQIEQDFGSLGGWQDTLNQLAEQQMNAQVARPLLFMLRAGLLHDRTMVDAKFDPQRLEEYFRSVMEAAKMAFPQAAQGNNGQPPAETATSDSLGPTSTTSQPSPSVATIEPSGV